MDQQPQPALSADAEEREIEFIKSRILRATSYIPKSVLQEGSVQKARAFKQHAHAARKVAEGKKPSLGRLRGAWAVIAPYYSKEDV